MRFRTAVAMTRSPRVTLDLAAADQSSYRGLTGGDGVTVVAMIRRPTRRDDDAIRLLTEIIEPDRR